MADLNYQFYTSSVNGQPVVEVASSYNTPYGYSPTDFKGALNTLASGLQWNIRNIQSAIAEGRMAESSKTRDTISKYQGYIDQLNNLISRGGNYTQADYDFLKTLNAGFGQLGLEGLNTVAGGGNVGTGTVSSYYNPLTGETLTNVSNETVRQIEDQVAGIQNGTLRDLGNGMTVPVGSAADALSQFTGQNVTQGEYPGSIVPNASVGAAPQTVGGATGTGEPVVTRDAQNNFYLDGRHITLDEFHSLGINADFVQPGQSVSLSQATGGTLPAGSSGITDEVQSVINNLYDNGYVINPNANIDVQSLDDFLAIAGNEINPYYASQLKIAFDQFKRTLGYTEQQLLQSEAETERKYGINLRTLGENAAEAGFAQSGLRKREERELAGETQRALDQGRQQLAYNAGNLAGSYAQTYAGLPGYQQPTRTLAEAPKVNIGEALFSRTGTESPYYQISPEVYSGLVGSEEFARRGAIQERASQLEGAQNLERSLATSLNY